MPTTTARPGHDVPVTVRVARTRKVLADALADITWDAHDLPTLNSEDSFPCENPF